MPPPLPELSIIPEFAYKGHAKKHNDPNSTEEHKPKKLKKSVVQIAIGKASHKIDIVNLVLTLTQEIMTTREKK